MTGREAKRGGPDRSRWETGKSSELKFWAAWLSSGGLGWPDDYRQRQDPQTPLAPHLSRLALSFKGPRIRVLDVGAGPLTRLGKVVPGRVLELTAVDAMALDYDRLLARAGVTPLVRSRPLESERLTERLPRDHFDLSYAVNTLDHSIDPILCIDGMIAVTRPGGLIVLEHASDEAERERYEGFHQWNLRREGDDLIVWRVGSRRSVRAATAHRASVVELGEDPETAYAVLRKHLPLGSPASVRS